MAFVSDMWCITAAITIELNTDCLADVCTSTTQQSAAQQYWLKQSGKQRDETEATYTKNSKWKSARQLTQYSRASRLTK